MKYVMRSEPQRLKQTAAGSPTAEEFIPFAHAWVAFGWTLALYRYLQGYLQG